MSMDSEQLSLLETSTVSSEYIVSQSNELISTPQNLTANEKKIIFTLASLVQPEDENFRTHRIRVKDLADMMGIVSSNFYKKVEETVTELQKKTVVIQSDKSKLVVNWLSSSEYFRGKGFVELEFSEKLRPYLLDLKRNYTGFKLTNVLSLQSAYSVRIYELLKSFEKLKRRSFSIEELRELLVVPPNAYKYYANLKSKVINKAKKDLEEKTDIKFEIEEIKKGKKVVGVTFYIERNDTFFSEVLLNDTAEETAYAAIIRMGIRPNVAKLLTEEYSEERIKDNISYVLHQKNVDHIENLSGYIVKAINEDFVTTRKQTSPKKNTRKDALPKWFNETDEEVQEENEQDIAAREFQELLNTLKENKAAKQSTNR